MSKEVTHEKEETHEIAIDILIGQLRWYRESANRYKEALRLCPLEEKVYFKRLFTIQTEKADSMAMAIAALKSDERRKEIE